MNSITIILNGTSSSGKTSIAKALQRLWPTPVFHAAVDTFLGMLNWSLVRTNEERNECFRFCIDSFHSMLPVLASGRYLLVVDHVFEQHSWFEVCRAALQQQDAYLIGIHCPLSVLEERERARGDRRVGLAKWQFERVHDQKPYDFQVDTSMASPEECAAAIIKFIENETAG